MKRDGRRQKGVLQQVVVEIAAGADLTTTAHPANGSEYDISGLSTAAPQILAAAVGVAKVCEWKKWVQL